MAWFDRNPGKKGPDAEPEKIPEAPKPVMNEPAPVAKAPEPKPAAKEIVPPEPITPGLVGYLYKGCRVTGQLSFQGPARIDGTVDGEVQCQDTLTIGEGAEIRAKISGKVVIIRGKVEGNVAAKEKLELAAPARLIGNVDTPRLLVTEGVVFEGNCSMGVAKQKGGFSSSQGVSADKAVAAQAPKLQADSKS
jgi:cytoskeletal protein CcmA (bactofilin family)